MAKPYSINIVNGVGTGEVLDGTYTVTANVEGYDNTSIDPSSLTVVEGTNEYSLSISATGTLTLHVTEDGTSGGVPVVGATFYRTSLDGTTYGNPIVTDSSGNAVFNNVPFSSASTINIYFKQTTSDGNHSFDDSVKTISLTESTLTSEIINLPAVTRTFNLTDKNYDNLVIDSGSITLS